MSEFCLHIPSQWMLTHEKKIEGPINSLCWTIPPTITKGWKINKSLSVWPSQAIWWVCLSVTGWPRAARCEAWDGATTVSSDRPNPQNLSTSDSVGGIPLLHHPFSLHTPPRLSFSDPLLSVSTLLSLFLFKVYIFTVGGILPFLGYMNHMLNTF